MSDANAASAPIAGAPFAAEPAAAASLQPPSPIPFRPGAPDEAGGSNVLGALLVCAACLVAAIAALRRWGPIGGRRTSGKQRLVEVVESSRLADRMRISVIRYRGRELLVAHSDHAATVLACDTDTAGRGAGS